MELLKQGTCFLRHWGGGCTKGRGAKEERRSVGKKGKNAKTIIQNDNTIVKGGNNPSRWAG